MEPEAIADSEQWEEMKKRHKAFNDAFSEGNERGVQDRAARN